MQMSWWVGKDREAFGEALKEHTDRIMRQGGKASRPERPVARVAPGVIVAEPPLPPAPAPAPAPTQQKTCERCGVQFTPKIGAAGQFCSRACYERPTPKARFQPWRPGSRGRAPKALRPIIAMAREFKRAIEAHPEAKSCPSMGRAAVVMIVGFLFRQQLDWVAAFTHYAEDDIAVVAQRLRASGIWTDDERIACEWGDYLFTDQKLSKQKQYESDIAFWLDAMAADGQIRREKRDGQVYYSAV